MTTDALLALLPVYGPWLLAVVTMAACLLVPVPASLMVLAGGAFSATGDLDWRWLAAATMAGAAAGDLICWRLGALLGARLDRGRAAATMKRARTLLHRHGIMAVFLSRWLVSPLGPYVNLSAGAAGIPLPRMIVPLIAGEAVWVTIYLTLGRVFGAQYEVIAQLATSVLGLLAALVVALGAGLWLWRRRSG